MMTDINAGIVVVTEFCTADNSKFNTYINYMDREEARKKHTDDYVLDDFKNYLNYMGDPEKIGGLFTNDKDFLNDEEIKKLKGTFKTAQENNSLMWQTVLSFDNTFLEELGIYDESSNLDDKKLKAAARKAINKMLEKEDLQNAVWSGAIHYNTDNIHIHVATVEPSPLREKKIYKQYEKIKVNGKWKYKLQTNEETGKKERIPVIDKKTGNIMMKEEYKGKFKNSSIEACKRELASSLVNNKELNAEITSIIRDKIISNKENKIADLPEIKDEFIRLYNDLPKDINRSLWKYKASVMKPFQMQIDKISKLYIDNYQKDNFTKLENKLMEKQEIYEKVYGGENKVYDNAIEDLYYRLGNKILKEMIYYDKVQAKKTIDTESKDHLSMKEELEEDKILDNKIKLVEDKILIEESEIVVEPTADILEAISNVNYKLEWSDQYKKAKKLLYTKKQYSEAKELLLSEAKEGNILAVCDLGDIYLKGLGEPANPEKGNEYYKEALNGLLKLYEDLPKKRSFLSYRIGKIYYYGMGTDVNYTKAKEWLEKSISYNNEYAMYLLGNMYFSGTGVEKNISQAITLYKMAENNPYAAAKLGDIYKKGIEVDIDDNLANKYYTKAFPALRKMADEEGADGNIKYKVGNMYYNGLGVETDVDMACKYFIDAMENGNEYAKYKMATIYLQSSNSEDIFKGITWLEQLSNNKAFKNNNFIHYKLGKIYHDGKLVNKDYEKAIFHYEKASAKGNEYAPYNLAKLYLEPNTNYTNYNKAITLLENIKDNPYAAAKLGDIYRYGLGVNRDLNKAKEYYKQAIDNGNIYAIDKLSKLEKYEKERINKNRKNSIRNVISSIHRQNQRDMQIAMMQLKRTLNDEYEKWRNLQEYEELQYQISKDGGEIEI